MNEHELDRLLQQPEEAKEAPLPQQFQKKVRKMMNRTLYSRIAVSILAVILLGVVTCFVFSQFASILFYDPGREPRFLEEDNRNGLEFSLMLEDTVSMLFPGVRCWVPNGYTATGFGRYDVNVLLDNTFDAPVLGTHPTHTFHIRASQLDTDSVFLAPSGNEFILPDAKKEALPGYLPDAIREELHNLPASAWLDVSISFSESLTADEVAELIRTNPDIIFQWLALEGQNASLFSNAAGGMFLYHTRCEQFLPEAAEQYPNYYLPQSSELTGSILEECLHSRLQLLLDHPDFVKMVESRFGDLLSIAKLKTRLDQLDDGWSCYGIRLMASPEDVEKLMDQLSATQVLINDVKVSRFQK